MEHTKAPGLRLRLRPGARPVAYWIASPAARRAGFDIKTVRLSGSRENIEARCVELQAEMVMWMSKPKHAAAPAPALAQVRFDGTLGSLLSLYQTHPDSSFHALKPGSRHPYLSYLAKLKKAYGDIRLADISGLDIMGWHRVWRAPIEPGGPEKLGAASMALAVLKAALGFGIVGGLAECERLRVVMHVLRLPKPAPRDHAPTAADVEHAIQAAHALGYHRAALCYALQFETMVRQWDLIGQWAPMDDQRPSFVLKDGQKWFGPTWGVIDGDLVLSIMPTKTEKSTRAKVHVNLSHCPMVTRELALIPAADRTGPLILNERTEFPYHADAFRAVWSDVRQLAGLPSTLWNRDLRAGGNTEAEIAGAGVEDRAKVAGHSTKVNERVYSRDRLAASDRVVELRTKLRSGE